MGEANYYLKAKFASEAAAQRGLKKMRRLFEQGVKAADYWQDHRNEKPDGFWPKFKEQFPAVCRYLRLTRPRTIGGDCNNALAGILDFGSEGDLESMAVEGDTLTYNAEVWHFAEWGGFVLYAKKVCGAERAGYVSDEHVDPGDCIRMT